ncbi:MAG: tRNA (adenosine(37)-N6)-dimethylallyltransferase MiaA [Chthoniobacteraceae bacterium]
MNALYLVGPTSVGKTEIALRVAARCNAEIIGADAFQIYQGLDLLTAKPSMEERSRIPHHLVDSVPLSQSFNVAQYLDAATRSTEEIAARGKLPLVVGGTGLYVRALTRGLSDLPEADAAIRAELEAAPLEDLQARYADLDPTGANLIDTKNKRRLIRAIEVCLLTGKPFSSFRDEWKTAPAASVGFFLTRDRDDLYERINRRVESMFYNEAVIEEVRRAPDIGATAGQVIGLREIQAHLRGEMNERKCIGRIQQATRRYAKRQLTWFKSEAALFEEVNLTSTSDLESLIERMAQNGRNAG